VMSWLELKGCCPAFQRNIQSVNSVTDAANSMTDSARSVTHSEESLSHSVTSLTLFGISRNAVQSHSYEIVTYSQTERTHGLPNAVRFRFKTHFLTE
jgi:hypothetical protein